MKNSASRKPLGILILLLSSLFVVACSGTSGDSLMSSSPSISTSGRTEQDRLINTYLLDGEDANGLAYYLSDTKNLAGTYDACVALGSCILTSITIPETYKGNPVIGIKEDGFAGDAALTGITFPTNSSFYYIGSQAFSDTSITTVQIPAGVTELNPATFLNCIDLENVYFLGTNVASIGEYCFANCIALKRCSLPQGLTTIGECAFQGDIRLLRFLFPSSLTTIGQGTFMDCYTAGLAYFPTAVTSVGPYAFKGCMKAQGYFNDSETTQKAKAGFLTNWDYVGLSYSNTLNNTPYRLNKTYAKQSLDYADGYIYIKNDASQTGSDYDITIIAYTGHDNTETAGSVDLTIPATLTDSDGYVHRIVGIDKEAFKNHTELGNLAFGTPTLPSFLTFLGDGAFAGCDRLKSLDLTNCHLLTSIGSQAFYRTNNNTANITAPSIFIPASVETIGSYAFSGFNKCTSLVFEDSASDVEANTSTTPNYPAYSLRSHLASIGDQAFAYLGNGGKTAPAAAACDLVLPCNYLTNIGTTYNGQPSKIRGVFEQAWALKSITFRETPTITTQGFAPAQVTIKGYAFYETRQVTAITLSSHVKEIDLSAFRVTKKTGSKYDIDIKSNIAMLHCVYIPSTVTTLGANAFDGRWRTTLYTDATAKLSGWDASFNALGDINIDGYNYIPIFYNVGDATGQRHLIHYSDPDNGQFDFITAADPTGSLSESTAALTRYYFDGSASVKRTPTVPATISGTYNGTFVTYTIDSIEQNAFLYSNTDSDASSLTSVKLPSSISSIGPIAFMNCPKITSFSSYTGSVPSDSTTYAGRLPSSLRTLSYQAFANDTGLKTFILPKEMITIATGVFGGCTALTSLSMITSDGSTTTQGDHYCCQDNVLYVGNAYQELLLGAPGASYNGTAALELPSTVTTIDKNAFLNATKLAGIKAPASLTSIGALAFQGCSAFKTFRFAATGNSALTISDNAFNAQTSLTTFEMTSRLSSIGESAFSGDTSLQYFPTTPGQTSFVDGALDLSATSLASLGKYAFNGCAKIKTLSLPSSLSTLPNNVFTGCTGLTTAVLGSGVTSIGDSCFSGDTALANVSIPNNVLTINANAFSGDTGLSNLSFGGSVEASIIGRSGTLTIKDSAFANCTNSSLTKLVIPDNAKFSFASGNYPFTGDSQLTLYLGCTAGTYSNTNNYPATWNYYKTGDSGNALPFKLYYPGDEDPRDTTYSYWHYVDGAPTAW